MKGLVLLHRECTGCVGNRGRSNITYLSVRCSSCGMLTDLVLTVATFSPLALKLNCCINTMTDQEKKVFCISVQSFCHLKAVCCLCTGLDLNAISFVWRCSSLNSVLSDGPVWCKSSLSVRPLQWPHTLVVQHTSTVVTKTPNVIYFYSYEHKPGPESNMSFLIIWFKIEVQNGDVFLQTRMAPLPNNFFYPPLHLDPLQNVMCSSSARASPFHQVSFKSGL